MVDVSELCSKLGFFWDAGLRLPASAVFGRTWSAWMAVWLDLWLEWKTGEKLYRSLNNERNRHLCNHCHFSHLLDLLLNCSLLLQMFLVAWSVCLCVCWLHGCESVLVFVWNTRLRRRAARSLMKDKSPEPTMTSLVRCWFKTRPWTVVLRASITE